MGASAKIVVAGLLLDSIPEALSVGIIIALDHGKIIDTVIALFLGNFSATMEGAKRMSEAGMTVTKIMIRWSFVLLVVAISAPLGFFLVNPLTDDEISILLGFAAGILIAFITVRNWVNQSQYIICIPYYC
jgi:zinc transporter ZupT